MNTKSIKRQYTPRANQWTLEDNIKLRQLIEEDGMSNTALSSVFGRTRNSIKKKYK
jgi:hypothetical protein